MRTEHFLKTVSTRMLGLFVAISLTTLLLLSLTGSLLAQTVTVTYNNTGSGYTFTVPCNATGVKAEVWGGGGGGGSAYYGGTGGNTSRAGGGGGGAFAVKTYGNGSLGVMTISVGAGGSGGVSNLTAGTGGDVKDGNAGSASICIYNSTTLTANGGAGGQHSNLGWTGHDRLQPGGGGTGGGATGGDAASCAGTSGGNGDAGGYGGGGCNGGGNTGNMSDGNNGFGGNAVGGGGAGGRTGKPFFGENKNGGAGANGKAVITFVLPVITIVSNDANLCIGATLSVQNPCADATYTWYKNGTVVATGNSYVANDVATYTVRATINYTYSGGSPEISGGNLTNFSNAITTKPRPAVTSFSDTICNNEMIIITPIDGVNGTVLPGTAYTWTVEDAGNVLNTANGSGYNFNSGIIRHYQTDNETVKYRVIPSTNGCAGAPFDIDITVRPAYNQQTYDTVILCDNELPYDYAHIQFPRGSVSGNHEIHFASVGHCDSLVYLRLIINKTYNDTLLTKACANSWVTHFPIPFLVEHDTVVSYMYQTVFGCDSMVTLNVKTMDTYLFEEIATICENQTYQFRGRDLTAAGVYYDSLHTVELGCDSVYKLTLTVNPTFLLTTIDTIYGNQQYSWRDNIYQNLPTGTHTFYDSLASVAGCDSVYQLVLLYQEKYEAHIVDTVCMGTPYTKYGFNLLTTTPGLHLDTLKYIAQANCDSLIYLTLWSNPTDTVHLFDEICMGETYGLYGFNEPAIMAGTFDFIRVEPNQFGCDSVIHLHLQVNPTYNFYYEEEICLGDRFNLYGLDTTPEQTGIFRLLIKTTTPSGCDSIIEIALTVNPAYHIVQYDTICQGNSYNRYGFDYSNVIFSVAGNHFLHEQHTTSSGCDSIRDLYLHVNPVYQGGRDTVTLCVSETPFRTGNRILFSSGVYLVNYKTQCLCDSSIMLALHVIPQPEEKHIYDTICQNIPYNRYDFAMNTSLLGTFTESHTTTQIGCDSVTTIHLSVVDKYTKTIATSVCTGEPYSLYGFNIPASATQTEVYIEEEQNLFSQDGCDSIVTLRLTINPVYENHILTTIFLGERYTDDGFDTLPTTPGIVQMEQHFSTITGCDSTITLHLTVKPLLKFENSVVICGNEIPYRWRGKMLNESGTVYDTTFTATSYDTIFMLHLTINKRFFISDTVKHCSTRPYVWRNRTLTLPGTYSDTLQTVAGCDSIYHILFSVHAIATQTSEMALCGIDNYTWHDKQYTQTGVYNDTLQTAAGCDSICILRLTFAQPFFSTENKRICNGETWTWHEKLLNAAGIYSDTLHAINGCDSICTLSLTIGPPKTTTENVTICFGKHFTWNDSVYTMSGQYIHIYNDGFCDSTTILNLTVRPDQHHDIIASICQGRNYDENGFHIDSSTIATVGMYTFSNAIPTMYCDSTVTLKLTVNPTIHESIVDTILRGHTYLRNGFNISVFETQQMGNFQHQILARTATGCDSIVTLALTIISEVGINEPAYAAGINLYPNPTQDMVFLVNNGALKIETVIVFDLSGKELYRTNGADIQNGISFRNRPAGVYLIQLITEQGASTYHKIIKQ